MPGVEDAHKTAVAAMAVAKSMEELMISHPSASQVSVMAHKKALLPTAEEAETAPSSVSKCAHLLTHVHKALKTYHAERVARARNTKPKRLTI